MNTQITSLPDQSSLPNRIDEIKQLEKDTQDLCEIFKNIHKLTELQDIQINKIVENFKETKNTTTESHKEIILANNYHSTTQEKATYSYTIIGGIVAGIVGIILFFVKKF